MAGDAYTQLQTPVQALGTVLPVVQAINQNKLFQGKIAVGNALQQATDPNTGQLDPLQFNKLIAANPDAAAAMQDAADQSQRLQNQQQALSANQLGLVGSTLSSVLNTKDPNQLHAATNAGLGYLVTAGVLPGWRAAGIAASLPQDPGELRQALQRLQLSLMPTGERQAALYGNNGITSDNGQLIPYNQASPMGGSAVTRTPGAITLTTAPGQAAAPETRLGPDGQPITAPAGTFMPPPMLPAGMRGGQGGPNPMGTGRYSQDGASAARPGAASSAPSAPTAPVVPGAGGVPMAGPAPGVAERNLADSKAYTDDLSNITPATTRIQTLQQAKSALSQALTGHGSAPVQTLVSIINTFSPDLAQKVLGASGPEQYDLARKYLTDYARSSGAATHSDAQLEAAKGSNASVDITNQAAQDVTSLQIGRERQRVAQVKMFGNPNGVGYGQHAGNFALKTDARGFAWDTYSPDQQQSILKSVQNDPAAKNKLLRSIGMASDPKFGWVPPAPSAAPSASPGSSSQ